MTFPRIRIGLLAASVGLTVAACELGPGAPQLPPQAPPDEAFTPVRHCYGVKPDPRFASRCMLFRNR